MKKTLPILMIYLSLFSIFAVVYVLNIAGSETSNEFRRRITIDNRGNPDALTNYQIFLNVTYDSDMQPDFDDLRFTWYDETSDQEASIDYWLDKYVASQYALVWVEAPSIRGLGGETLYMYYGDPDAVSESNGEETFVFFDGFSTDTTSNYELWSPIWPLPSGNPYNEFNWDSNGWLFVNASTRERPGRNSNVHVTHKTAQIDAREEKYWLETRGKAFGTGVLDYFGVGCAYKYCSVPDDDYELFCLVRRSPYNTIQSKWGPWEFGESGWMSTGKDEWHRFGVGTSSDGTVIGKFYDDDYNEIETLVNQTIHQDNEWWVDLLASRLYTDTWATLCVYFDYVRVRKFTDPEPSYSIGPEEPLPATVDIDPDTLNLKSNGEWITAYIELPESYDVNNIDVSTILLNDTIPVDTEAPITVGDYDLDNIPDLMVKFDRAAIIQWLNTNDYSDDIGKYYEVNLTITGTVAGTQFSGTDKIKVLKR